MNIVFIETESFTKNLPWYMGDEEFSAFQQFLGKNPTVGNIIPRTGGLRKIRWLGKGKGKRGGLRIIYYYHLANGEIMLMAIYAKNEAEDLTTDQLKFLRQELLKWKRKEILDKK